MTHKELTTANPLGGRGKVSNAPLTQPHPVFKDEKRPFCSLKGMERHIPFLFRRQMYPLFRFQALHHSISQHNCQTS